MSNPPGPQRWLARPFSDDPETKNGPRANEGRSQTIAINPDSERPDVTSDLNIIAQKFDGSTASAAKPVETFWLERDPLTGERLEPVYRAVIPVYDAVTGELREFLP